ncbi:hypothetical protein Hdeb2414_s0056g00756821 [Helianthus debilis subsp. tardiflorus]
MSLLQVEILLFETPKLKIQQRSLKFRKQDHTQSSRYFSFFCSQPPPVSSRNSGRGVGIGRRRSLYGRYVVDKCQQMQVSLQKEFKCTIRNAPELMKLVEEFYRAYRAFAERYDFATNELYHA